MKWGYKRAFVRCALLFLAGAALQLITGGLDNSFLRHPWGLIISINYLYLLILAYAKSDSWTWVRKLYDRHAMTSSLAAMVVMCIIFGLTAQNGSTEGIAGALGFRNMKASWSFGLIFFYFTSVLGLRAIDDIRNWRSRRLIPSLSHAAVFLVLAAGIFSAGEKTRVRIKAPLGHPVHTAMKATGEEYRLPFPISLKSFDIKEYPAQLYMIDPSKGSSESLEGWDIKVLKNLEMAGRLKDSTDYIPMEHVGATTAMYIEAIHQATGRKAEGWVSCGSHIFPPAMLQISETEAIAMPQREPEHYLSEILVTDEKGDHIYNIKVNKPAKTGAWRIYQVGYDKERGKWSTYSILECVKDGWYPLIRTGLWLILASGVAMALTAGRSRRKKEVQP